MHLNHSNAAGVEASVMLTLLDHVGEPVPAYCL
jgi:hypothetical protein